MSLRAMDNAYPRNAQKATILGVNSGVVLTLILCVALGLRLWGIGFGLPHRYHIDEPYTVLGALRNAQGDFSPRLPPNSPNLWEYILLAEYGALYLVGKLAGLYPTAWDFAHSYRADPTWFYLLARGTSAVLGTATVAVVFETARSIYQDVRAGLLAAFFLSVAFVPGREAHYAVADTFVAFLTAVGVYFWTRHARGKGMFALLLGSLLVGIAGGIKWRPLGLGTGLVAAALLHNRECSGTSTLGWKVLPRLVLAGLAAVAGFLVGFPGPLISTDLFRWHITYILSWGSPVEMWPQESSGGTGWLWDPLPGWLFYLRMLARGLGIPLLLASLGSIVTALRRRHAGELVVWASILGYFAAISVLNPHFLRYALPLYPLLAVQAAGLVSAALRLLRKRSKATGRVASAALVVGLAMVPAARLVRYDYLLTRIDTRTLAKTWIEAYVPDGARIAVDWPVHSPPLSVAGDREPGSVRVYDVTVVNGTGLQTYPPDWYREQEIDYLIASGFVYQIPMEDGAQETERLAFYAALEQEFELVQEFWPNDDPVEPAYVMDEIFGPIVSLWQRQRPGPTIKVYRVRP